MQSSKVKSYESCVTSKYLNHPFKACVSMTCAGHMVTDVVPSCKMSNVKLQDGTLRCQNEILHKP